MRSSLRASLALAAVLAGIGGAVGPVSAVDCKAIDAEATCRTTAGCGWVNGYTISRGKYQGKVIKPFCRKKAAQPAASAPALGPAVQPR